MYRAGISHQRNCFKEPGKDHMMQSVSVQHEWENTFQRFSKHFLDTLNPKNCCPNA